jgi:hypothetical protein
MQSPAPLPGATTTYMVSPVYSRRARTTDHFDPQRLLVLFLAISVLGVIHMDVILRVCSSSIARHGCNSRGSQISTRRLQICLSVLAVGLGPLVSPRQKRDFVGYSLFTCSQAEIENSRERLKLIETKKKSRMPSVDASYPQSRPEYSIT